MSQGFLYAQANARDRVAELARSLPPRAGFAAALGAGEVVDRWFGEGDALAKVI